MTILDKAIEAIRDKWRGELAYRNSIVHIAPEGGEVWAQARAWVENSEEILSGWIATDAPLLAVALAQLNALQRQATEVQP